MLIYIHVKNKRILTIDRVQYWYYHDTNSMRLPYPEQLISFIIHKTKYFVPSAALRYQLTASVTMP